MFNSIKLVLMAFAGGCLVGYVCSLLNIVEVSNVLSGIYGFGLAYLWIMQSE